MLWFVARVISAEAAPPHPGWVLARSQTCPAITLEVTITVDQSVIVSQRVESDGPLVTARYRR